MYFIAIRSCLDRTMEFSVIRSDFEKYQHFYVVTSAVNLTEKLFRKKNNITPGSPQENSYLFISQAQKKET